MEAEGTTGEKGGARAQLGLENGLATKSASGASGCANARSGRENPGSGPASAMLPVQQSGQWPAWAAEPPRGSLPVRTSR